MYYSLLQTNPNLKALSFPLCEYFQNVEIIYHGIFSSPLIFSGVFRSTPWREHQCSHDPPNTPPEARHPLRSRGTIGVFRQHLLLKKEPHLCRRRLEDREGLNLRVVRSGA